MYIIIQTPLRLHIGVGSIVSKFASKHVCTTERLDVLLSHTEITKRFGRIPSREAVIVSVGTASIGMKNDGNFF